MLNKNINQDPDRSNQVEQLIQHLTSQEGTNFDETQLTTELVDDFLRSKTEFLNTPENRTKLLKMAVEQGALTPNLIHTCKEQNHEFNQKIKDTEKTLLILMLESQKTKEQLNCDLVRDLIDAGFDLTKKHNGTSLIRLALEHRVEQGGQREHLTDYTERHNLKKNLTAYYLNSNNSFKEYFYLTSGIDDQDSSSDKSLLRFAIFNSMKDPANLGKELGNKEKPFFGTTVMDLILPLVCRITELLAQPAMKLISDFKLKEKNKPNKAQLILSPLSIAFSLPWVVWKGIGILAAAATTPFLWPADRLKTMIFDKAPLTERGEDVHKAFEDFNEQSKQRYGINQEKTEPRYTSNLGNAESRTTNDQENDPNHQNSQRAPRM